MALIRGRDKKSGAQIFTASMADIVFLLIVFFVLTYKVEVDRTQMNLPETWIRIKVPEKAAVISISPPDANPPLTIRVSTGEEMSLPVSTDEEIVTFASTEVAQNPNKEFIVKADESVPYERVDAVLDALKQSKVKYIFLLSEQKTVK
ncbi:MAG: biopolymer transporter ExbD [Thermoanaerobaculales bacterium]|nr:biopolymer transporter ExbD [Thermoanaerobaculales bacterium]